MSELQPLTPHPYSQNSWLIHVSHYQDYTQGWLGSNMTVFHHQAALTATQKWSVINPTLYSICFIGVARATTRCEICLATSHSTKDCAQQGNPDPGLLDRIKALESMVLSVSARASPSAAPLENCQQMDLVDP